MTLKNLSLLLGKWLLLILVFTICFILGTMISGLANANPDAGDPDEGPVFLYLLANSALTTALLAWLTLRSGWPKGKSMAALFTLLFLIGSLLPQLDSLFFAEPLGMNTSIVGSIIFSGAVAALLYVPISVWLLYPQRWAASALTDNSSGFPLGKIAVLSLVYLFIYFLFGYFVAWQSPALREFYSGTTAIQPFWSHLQNTWQESPALFGLQLVRGFIWSSLAYLAGRMIQGQVWEKIIVIALLFSLVGMLLLLLPNPYMPEEIRKVHLVEVVSSNLLFGLIAGSVLFLWPWKTVN